MKRIFFLLALTLLAFTASAAIVTREITYTIDSTTFKGLMAYDDAVTTKRPGILVVHEWWGLNDFTKSKAKEVAALGYVAFAADMYGNGRKTEDPKTAGAWAGTVRGTPKMRQRVMAAYQELLKQEYVDAQRTGAMGFCFGGSAVLELSYSGANVKSIVSFHGGLFAPQAKDAAALKAKYLILHGADDPSMTPEVISRFQAALRQSKVDWQMVYYGNAVHAFTNPAGGADNSKGSAYNRVAADRAWRLMQEFFTETL